MKIIAFDSSGLVASVAVLEDDVLVSEYTVNYKKTHSQTLLPMLAEITKMIELDMSTIDAIAIASGPGSFTGLRIGAATAKGFGLALNKPIIPVPTLEGLAYNVFGTNALVCPLMDARRNQVYTGVYCYERGDDGVISQVIIKDQCAILIDEIVEYLNSQNREVIFLGDGVPVHSNYIMEHIKVPYSFAPSHMNRQRAGSIAALGQIRYREGRIETAEMHGPDYLRASQAERERMEKMGNE